MGGRPPLRRRGGTPPSIARRGRAPQRGRVGATASKVAVRRAPSSPSSSRVMVSGRVEADDVAASAVGHAGAGVEHDAVAQARLAEAHRHAIRALERLLGGLVAHELDARHQAADAHVAHERVRAQRLQQRLEVRLEVRDVRRDALALPGVQHGHPGRHRHRVAAEREDVLEARPGRLERLADAVADRDRAQRRVAAADALAHREDVGHHAPVVDREVLAGASEPGDHLVHDEQHAVAVADLADERPVVVRRRDGAAHGRDDRLRDERSHLARPHRPGSPTPAPRRSARRSRRGRRGRPDSSRAG